MCKELLAEATRRLSAGEAIVFPTETVYGLGADPRSTTGMQAVLASKSRGSGEGLPCIASSLEQVEWLVSKSRHVPEDWRVLAERFWPGPLSLVFPASDDALRMFHPGVFGPDQTIAVRVSGNPQARALAEALGTVLPATSANPHGARPASTDEEARDYFPALFILPSVSPLEPSPPSTILNVSSRPYQLIREGAIGRQELVHWL